MNPRKGMIKKLDTWVSLKVRSLGFCQIGKARGKICRKDTLQCAHIFSRSNLSTRWWKQNLLCSCAGCHAFFAHKNPVEFTETVKKILGEEGYEQLRTRASLTVKYSYNDLKNLLTYFKQGGW